MLETGRDALVGGHERRERLDPVVMADEVHDGGAGHRREDMGARRRRIYDQRPCRLAPRSCSSAPTPSARAWRASASATSSSHARCSRTPTSSSRRVRRTPPPSTAFAPPRTSRTRRRALRPLIAAADAVIAPPQWPLVARWLRACDARVIHDLYTPEALEAAQLFAARPAPVRRLMVSANLDRLHDALHSAPPSRLREREAARPVARRAAGATPDRARARRRRPGPARRDRRRAVRNAIRAAAAQRRRRGSAARCRRSARRTRSCCGTAGSGAGSTRRPRCGQWRCSPSGDRRCGSSSWAARRRMPRRSARPRRRRTSPASSACSTRRCSFIASGCRTTSAWTGCSTRTAPCRRTPTRSRRATRFARGCSTASGPGCRSSRRRATSSPRGSPPTTSARWSQPATSRATAAAIERVLDRGRDAFAPALARASAAYGWPVAARPARALDRVDRAGRAAAATPVPARRRAPDGRSPRTRSDLPARAPGDRPLRPARAAGLTPGPPRARSWTSRACAGRGC